MHGPISDILADRFTVRGVQLLRFDAHLRRRALTVLKKLEAELAGQVAQFDPYGPSRTTYQRARLDALLRWSRATIASRYRTIREGQTRQMEDLVDDEATRTADLINRTVGADVMSAGVTETQLAQIVSGTLIEGSPAASWWGEQSKALQRRFTNQMQMGAIRGETVDELVRRVRGTRANGYTDGIMETSRREAQALVRTAIQGVSNGARMAVFRANDDVVRGVQALVTLDGRTTEICIARSGGAWDLEGAPLPESTRQEPFPGYPPWHWGCRTTLIAVLRTVKEMLGLVGSRKAATLRALPKATQSSMDGQVAASLTYEQWLNTKPEAFQRDVLGRGKWELWQAGGLTLSELIDQSGRPLSLEQLKAAA